MAFGVRFAALSHKDFSNEVVKIIKSNFNLFNIKLKIYKHAGCKIDHNSDDYY